MCFECRSPIEHKEGLREFCTVDIVLRVFSHFGVCPNIAQQLTPPTVKEGDAPACSICLTEPRNTAFLCGHQLCWDCAQRVDHCPVCRKFVTHRIRLFQ